MGIGEVPPCTVGAGGGLYGTGLVVVAGPGIGTGAEGVVPTYVMGVQVSSSSIGGGGGGVDRAGPEGPAESNNSLHREQRGLSVKFLKPHLGQIFAIIVAHLKLYHVESIHKCAVRLAPL